jgi:hypothetical protein
MPEDPDAEVRFLKCRTRKMLSKKFVCDAGQFVLRLHAPANHGRVCRTPHSTGKATGFHKAAFYFACTPQATTLTVTWQRGRATP